jgi:hypothetical protein
MAKKKQQKPLNRREVFNPKTDKVEIRFYNGRKKATQDEIRAEIKANAEKIDPNQLGKEERSYLQKVLAGKARAAKGVKIDGKYVNPLFLDESPVDFRKMAQDEGFKSPEELLRKSKVAQQIAKQIYENPEGLKSEINGFDLIGDIDNWGGRIFINGKEVSKKQAIQQTDSINSLMLQRFEGFTNKFNIEYRKGFTELHITLPTEEEVSNKTAEELEEEGLAKVVYPFNKKGTETEKTYSYKAIFLRKRHFTRIIEAKGIRQAWEIARNIAAIEKAILVTVTRA